MKSILELIWDGITDFTNGEESEAKSIQYLTASYADKMIYVGCKPKFPPDKIICYPGVQPQKNPK